MKNIISFLLASIELLIATTLVYGEMRELRPLQIQYTPVSVFIWNAPGISIGYHVNHLLYIGGVYQAQYTNEYTYPRGSLVSEPIDEMYGIKDAEKTQTHYGSFKAIELRVSPLLESGAFLSLLYFQMSEQTETTLFKRQERRIGKNLYTTELTIELHYPDWYSQALGFGYNHVFESGISVGVGEIFGIPWLNQTQKPTVNIRSMSSDLGITSEDIEALKKKVKGEAVRGINKTYLSFGYNF